jgi:hypothetical protein
MMLNEEPRINDLSLTFVRDELNTVEDGDAILSIGLEELCDLRVDEDMEIRPLNEVRA